MRKHGGDSAGIAVDFARGAILFAYSPVGYSPSKIRPMLSRSSSIVLHLFINSMIAFSKDSVVSKLIIYTSFLYLSIV